MLNKVKCTLFVLSFLLLIPNQAHAQCTNERLSDLATIASNVNISYNYNQDEFREINFTTSILNIPNDIYVKDNKGNTFYSNTDQEYDPGESISYEIYSNDNNCKNELLLTKYINIPNFNNYYPIEDCIEEPNFKYCNPWKNTNNITKEKFDKEYTKYINEYYYDDYDDSDDIETSNIKQYFDKNKILLIGLIIGIIILIIGIIFRNRWSYGKK